MLFQKSGLVKIIIGGFIAVLTCHLALAAYPAEAG